ncbi:MAG: AAA family ATPase [Alphaproteobacteria bacterium]|nr:AAA family ATPase [Alphaproteobacteria bacterium]MBQ9235839.1 AAA family ATPase [Alphaproteobacteria bacterium]
MDANKKSHIIVISNEKGGTGKSTISMHLAVKLMYENYKIAVIDLDGRQGSLSKYVGYRRDFCKKNHITLPIPLHYIYEPLDNKANSSEIKALIEELSTKVDAVIIDTPGTKNYLFELAHLYPHTLVTPISDSLVDLSVIADIDPTTGEIVRAGHYAEYIWEVKKKLAAKGLSYLNWVVCGNKVSNLRSNNKNLVFGKLENLSKLYGFRFTSGLKDRVIYKELYLNGLTVLDLNQPGLNSRMSMSQLAAKVEFNNVVEFIFAQN